MNIRTASTDDSKSIAGIWNPIIRNTTITFTTEEKTEAGMAREIAERHKLGMGFLVAEQGGEVLGFATYFPFRNGPGYSRTVEHSVNLAPQARGQGTGRALMASLQDHARAQGKHSMIAGISIENAAAVRFHLDLGFSKVAEIPEAGWKFDRWLDLVLLQKRL